MKSDLRRKKDGKMIGLDVGHNLIQTISENDDGSITAQVQYVEEDVTMKSVFKRKTSE